MTKNNTPPEPQSAFSRWTRRIVTIIILVGFSRAVLLWMMFSDHVLYEPGRMYEYEFSYTYDEKNPDDVRGYLHVQGKMRREVIETPDGNVLSRLRLRPEQIELSGILDDKDGSLKEKFNSELGRDLIIREDKAGTSIEILSRLVADEKIALMMRNFFDFWRAPLPTQPTLHWQASEKKDEGEVLWRGETDLPCSFLTLHDLCLRYAPKYLSVPDGPAITWKGEKRVRYDAWHRHPVILESNILWKKQRDGKNVLQGEDEFKAQLLRVGDLEEGVVEDIRSRAGI